MTLIPHSKQKSFITKRLNQLKLAPASSKWSEANWATLLDAHLDLNKDRFKVAIQVFSKELGVNFPDDLKEYSEILLWAAACQRGEDSSSEGLVPPILGARALKTLDSLSGEYKKNMNNLLLSVETKAEKAILLKGLAARSHRLDDQNSFAELIEIRDIIRGQSFDWISENTTCYNTEIQEGIKQAWTTSCGPSVNLLLEAEIDPLIALKVNTDLFKPLGAFSFAAREEKRDLIDFGGIAVARANPLRKLLEAKGMTLKYLLDASDILDENFELLGDFSAEKFAKLLSDSLLQGYDIPMRIADSSNNNGHFISAVDQRRIDSEDEFRIHDPWHGTSAWVPASDVLNGWAWETDSGIKRSITHIYMPKGNNKKKV